MIMILCKVCIKEIPRCYCGAYIYEVRCRNCYPSTRVRRLCDECSRREAARKERERYAERKAAGQPSKPSGRAKMPCAKCGAAMDVAPTSLPVGVATCLKCRRAAWGKTCQHCGADFPGRKRGKYCSRACFHAAQRKWPSDAERYVAKRRARRATEKGLGAEPYTLAEIAERDSFTCGICRQVVDMGLPGDDRWGPTIDHVKPIAAGGNDMKDNVQLAHWICNVRKGARHQ